MKFCWLGIHNHDKWRAVSTDGCQLVEQRNCIDCGAAEFRAQHTGHKWLKWSEGNGEYEEGSWGSLYYQVRYIRSCERCGLKETIRGFKNSG